MNSYGYTRVQATADEIAAFTAKKGYGPVVYRVQCDTCGKRIWGSGLGIGSHSRSKSCRSADAAKTVAVTPIDATPAEIRALLHDAVPSVPVGTCVMFSPYDVNGAVDDGGYARDVQGVVTGGCRDRLTIATADDETVSIHANAVRVIAEAPTGPTTIPFNPVGAAETLSAVAVGAAKPVQLTQLAADMLRYLAASTAEREVASGDAVAIPFDPAGAADTTSMVSVGEAIRSANAATFAQRPRFPEGTPEYDAYAAEMKTELAKWAAGEGEYVTPREGQYYRVTNRGDSIARVTKVTRTHVTLTGRSGWVGNYHLELFRDYLRNEVLVAHPAA